MEELLEEAFSEQSVLGFYKQDELVDWASK
jgi:hypothetical protein